MNVRFFAGTRADYDSLPSPRNPLGLYFCADTNELFWADRLLTDGVRVVHTFADLPVLNKAADGVVYYVTETRNGYTLSPDRKEWLQTIYAPATDAYKVPESEYYNTVTTVGAVRDIEDKIYDEVYKLDKRIAKIEVGASESGVEAIYFAGVKLDKLNGTHTIDRLCALRALGFVIPEDQEEFDLVTKEYVDSQIAAAINSTQYYTKAEVDSLIPDTSDFAIKSEIPSLDGLASEAYVDEKFDAISIPDIPTKVSELENDIGYLTELQDLSEYAKKTEIPNVPTKASELTNDVGYITSIPDEYITEAELNAKNFITEHQNLDAYAKKTELFSKSYNDLTDTPEIPSVDGLASEEYVDNAIASIEHPTVDLSGHALKSEVAVKADDIPFATNRYVSNAIGSFAVGDSVKGLTVSELFAKLLGLVATPKNVVENIITNRYGLYQFNDSLDVEYIEFTRTIFESADEYESAPTESTFYQYKYVNDDGEEITESGYQHFTLAQDFIYYMVILPSSLVIGENVKVQVWSPSRNMWMDTLTTLESDPKVIADTFTEVGLAMPTIPDGYTMWIDLSDVNPGNKVRYIIIE